MTDIPALRKLLTEASPVPWQACGTARGGCQCGWVWSITTDQLVVDASVRDPDIPPTTHEQAKANALLVAAAISALPELLDELERLRGAHV